MKAADSVIHLVTEADGFGFNDNNRQLLYVPTLNDANVVYGANDEGSFRPSCI